MKKCIAVLFILISVNLCFAQNRKPLTGKGELISRKEPLPSFKVLEFYGMDGQVTVDVQKNAQPEILCNVDENLNDLLRYEVRGKTLAVFINGNRNNVLYIENTRIEVKIVCPELEEIRFEGNADIAVAGIEQQSLKVKKEGNGNMTLSGKVNTLTIHKEGNGKVDAQALPSESAEIMGFGNGNIYVNASVIAKGVLSGNGSVKNTGEGETQGTTFGNGKFISRKTTESLSANPVQRVHITFVNESAKKENIM
ncbi:MAG: DUF2807 domain-containing protein [Bacteroidia bacterium]|nr:DUF2807 domain-containing protein [Bacteroidia bacterium]